MAMARDGLLPGVFGTVHPRFRTPHIATIVTGAVICLTAALTPIMKLEEMVNVGTLMAFVIVCAAVLMLRIQRPDAKRPFRCPVIWLVAPLGMLVNLTADVVFAVGHVAAAGDLAADRFRDLFRTAGGTATWSGICCTRFKRRATRASTRRTGQPRTRAFEA